jgi:hypothetical protein
MINTENMNKKKEYNNNKKYNNKKYNNEKKIITCYGCGEIGHTRPNCRNHEKWEEYAKECARKESEKDDQDETNFLKESNYNINDYNGINDYNNILYDIDDCELGGDGVMLHVLEKDNKSNYSNNIILDNGSTINIFSNIHLLTDLRKENYLKTSNLGDSGYMILRPDKNKK